jgi:phosphoribosylaminoimidazolecarboxamide formyltransferase/IMP cyclohydrolase
MLRAAAKNSVSVTVLPSASAYPAFLAELEAHNGGTTLAARRRWAAETFTLTAVYDTAISTWYVSQTKSEEKKAETAIVKGDVITRQYIADLPLKYGCNPHQNPAFLGHLSSYPGLPFAVVNGLPGYINLLDACNAYQLAMELAAIDGGKTPAAASFKHVSPAGAALAAPLSPLLEEVYDVSSAALTPVALAYVRARNADPMCSFGDFAAVSHVVDEATAMCLKTEVSDGIIAPGYTPEALAILKTKKSGNFIILQADPSYKPPQMEYREVFGTYNPPTSSSRMRATTSCLRPSAGAVFAQRRNDAPILPSALTEHIVTTQKELPAAALRDLLLALIAIKYTQSNSVGYALDGQMIGVGAGQQSRVDCVKLAGRKVTTWFMRQHPKVRALKFKSTVKRQEKVNARVRYIEGDFTSVEYAEWVAQFDEEPAPFTDAEKSEFLGTLKGVSLASDAFFPFRDSLDVAARYGVSYVAQPGGSVKDADVTRTADEYGMVMSHNGLRLFHH